MTRTDPTQERGRRTKAYLLRVAHRVIQRDGRDLFRVTTIMEESGFSAGTFFRYWSDRRDLIRDLYPNSIEGLAQPRFLDDEDGNLLTDET